MILRTWQEHQWFYIWHLTPAACWRNEKLFYSLPCFISEYVVMHALPCVCMLSAPYGVATSNVIKSMHHLLWCWTFKNNKIIFLLKYVYLSIDIFFINRATYLMYIGRAFTKDSNGKITLAVTVEHMYSMVPILKSSYSKNNNLFAKSMPNTFST